MSSEIDNRECVLTMHETILKYHLERLKYSLPLLLSIIHLLNPGSTT